MQKERISYVGKNRILAKYHFKTPFITYRELTNNFWPGSSKWNTPFGKIKHLEQIENKEKVGLDKKFYID